MKESILIGMKACLSAPSFGAPKLKGNPNGASPNPIGYGYVASSVMGELCCPLGKQKIPQVRRSGV